MTRKIKEAKVRKGFDQIIIPGERSQKKRSRALKSGYLVVGDKLWKEINSF